MRITLYVMGHTQIKGHIGPEQFTVIQSQGRHKDCIFIKLPHILQIKMLLFNFCLTHGHLIDTFIIFFLKISSVKF